MLIAENDRPFRKVNIRWIFKGWNTKWWVSQKVKAKLFFGSKILISLFSSVLQILIGSASSVLQILIGSASSVSQILTSLLRQYRRC